MSQQGGYYYQNYTDPNNPLKSRPPTMVNGQPGATQQVQNGIQPPHFNLAGTPSSQSSRDPSRETSRDPSPTQYLHGPYRPQLQRPPMPPINGQQNSNPNIMPPPPRMTQPQQYGPSTIPYNAHTAQFNSNTANSSPATSASNALPGIVPLPSNMPLLQLPTSQATSQMQQSGMNKNLMSEPGTGTVKTELHSPGQSYQWMPTTQHANLPGESGNTLGMSNSTDSASNVNQTPLSGPPLPVGQPHPSNQMSKPLPDKVQTAKPVAPVQQTQPMNWPLNQSSNQANQDTSPASIGPPKNPLHLTKPESQATSPPSLPTVPQMHPPQQKFGSQQNIFSSTTSSTQNVPTFSQPTNAGTHNVFNNQPNPQPPLNQGMPGSREQQQQQGVVQDAYSSQVKSQYGMQPPPTVGQMQQNVLGGQKDLPPMGPTPPQSQNFYGSQPNLASQRKYPQTSYGAQAPPPSTANLSSPEMASTRPPMPPPANPGQVRSPTGMPPLPGQQVQQQNQYDPRVMYPGQMSNVPLDSMTKRYPGSYPDQMNQLNNQMTNMSVTQGFNKAWGMRCVDLLQCRNVLPPSRVEPPEIRLHQEFLDSVNCSPDIFRCTLTKIPDSNSLLQKSRLPLGVLIHPFKDLIHLPVIQCRTIVRCRVCRTYINPFVYFVDSKRWKCNLCYRLNDLPEEFQFDPVTKSYGDPSRRPEVKNSTIEFIAPSEYMLRPPQPAVYLFILDVSRLAVESGYLTVVCNTIAEELNRLPGDGRTQVGFMAIDSAIHFFSMPDNVSQPHEMIMLDVEDVFLPCPDNLIVNLKEREELIRDLLAQLPTKFEGTHDTNNALGAGLQVAFKLMSPTGGRVTVFQTCLPNLGPGLLQAREDPNTRASKDVPHLNPATDFYKRLALGCSGQQIAVDLFLLNSQYCDLATLSGICKFSGGCIYHLPLFRASKFQCNETLERMLRRYLARKIGFEAVMRMRCTRGLSIHTFHGNFFVRSTDLLSLPNINPDTGFGMQISIEESLSDVQNVCFQAALLYTSSKGERRIRVHTLCLPVVTSLSDVLHSADQQCIIGLLSKMAVDRSQQSSLSDARDALINVAIDVLSAYKLSQSVASTGLLVPGNLELLPLYIIALLKCVAFRSGTSTRLDDRVFAMCQLKTLPLYQLIQMVYPDLYPIHALDDRNSKDIDGKVCPQPPRLHLSAEKLDSRGAFLMDAGDKIFIYVGKNIHPTFCCNVLGVSAFQAIHEEFYELPELDTIESERLRNFVFSLQEEKPYYASVQIIRDDSHFRTLFVERLIEDRFESALSYYEFLQHLKTQVK